MYSFANNRKVCIRLDDEVDPERDINCGLPQGSPISPILFILYISPLSKLKELKNKSFGYADDVAIFETSHSLDINVEKIITTINNAIDWGISQGLTLDPGKSELIHFSRRHRDKGYKPEVVTSQFLIRVDEKRPYLMLLGIHFDRKLSFKHQVRIQTSKALKNTNALRCLGNTTRDVSPRLSRQAITACILPIAHFGAELSGPGKCVSKVTKRYEIELAYT